VVFLAALPPHSARAASRQKPNIVLILIDDLGWRDLACCGSTFHDTPHIDRLARRGMKFTNGYATCCVCSPSRASILTGQYPARLHLTDYIPGWSPKHPRLRIPAWTQHLDPRTGTIAQALRQAGYRTASIGKWHLGGNQISPDAGEGKEFAPEKQGFDVNIAGGPLGQPPDYFFPYRRKLPDGRVIRLTKLPGGRAGEYLTDRLTDEAEKFIERNKDRPFFLYLAHYAVHTAMGARLQARAKTIARYRAKRDPQGVQKNPVYAAMVESMDESVGRVVRKLADLKLAGRTLVIFTSDNGGYGAATSNAPLRGSKSTPYEGGIRVPLILSWPGVVKPGSVCDTAVTGADFYPTLLELAGVKPKAGRPVDGESLMPLLTRKGGLHRNAVYWHYPHYSEGTTPYGAVRQENYKLIEFYETGRLELYNLQKDLNEKNNLAGKMPAKAKELRKLLADWRKRVKAQMPTPNPDYQNRERKRACLIPRKNTACSSTSAGPFNPLLTCVPFSTGQPRNSMR
jgi:arylsulfatase A-like enzyme